MCRRPVFFACVYLCMVYTHYIEKKDIDEEMI